MDVVSYVYFRQDIEPKRLYDFHALEQSKGFHNPKDLVRKLDHFTDILILPCVVCPSILVLLLFLGSLKKKKKVDTSSWTVIDTTKDKSITDCHRQPSVNSVTLTLRPRDEGVST